ncbi:MAG: hypothetical protein Q4F60_03620 [Candidatus Saccharibacteria bacterium]|nr:hypothetical protein [Candidatus Saccharibacteria bacterium]
MAVLKMNEREIRIAETVSQEELRKAYVGGSRWTEKTAATGFWCIPRSFEGLKNWNPSEEYKGWQIMSESAKSWRLIYEEWINQLITEARALLVKYDFIERERRILAEFLADQNEPLAMTRNLCASMERQGQRLLDEARILYGLSYFLNKRGQKSNCPWKTL